jgi:large subunit ribosomal protein L22
MVSKAYARYIRIAPRKLRVVINLVRGKKVEDALNILKFTPRAGAKVVSKVVASALANATQKGDVDVDTLVVENIQVDEGPALKRYLPRAMGRATRVRKKSSHITVELEQRSK